MSPTPIIIRIAFATAVGLAWALERRAPRHRPAALALSAFFVVDAARPILLGKVPSLVDAALFLATYAIQAALAVYVFAPTFTDRQVVPDLFEDETVMRAAPQPRRWPQCLGLTLVFSAWACAVGALVGWWELAPSIYTVAFASALIVQVGGALIAAVRHRRALPNPAQGVAIILAISAIADATGPWRAARPHYDWIQGDRVAVITWILVSAWETWQWTASCPQRSS